MKRMIRDLPTLMTLIGIVFNVSSQNFTKSDLKKLNQSNLVAAFQAITAQLAENPFFPNQSLKKLTPPGLGKYSRRLNAQHRVVYTVDRVTKVVSIWSAWIHYENH